MLVTILSAFIALGASFFITPIIRKIAIRFKIFASPNGRTIHRKLVPKLGGVGIFVAFISGMLVYAFLTQNFQQQFWGLLASGAVVLFIGFFDDLYDLGCYRKLIGQTLAALIAVQFGFVIRAISLPLEGTWEVAFLGQAISVFLDSPAHQRHKFVGWSGRSGFRISNFHSAVSVFGGGIFRPSRNDNVGNNFNCFNIGVF